MMCEIWWYGFLDVCDLYVKGKLEVYEESFYCDDVDEYFREMFG